MRLINRFVSIFILEVVQKAIFCPHQNVIILIGE